MKIKSLILHLSLDNKLQKFLNKIAKELYVEKRLKEKEIALVFKIMDQYLTEKQKKPENIVNWCINNKSNSTAQSIFASYYYFNK